MYRRSYQRRYQQAYNGNSSYNDKVKNVHVGHRCTVKSMVNI